MISIATPGKIVSQGSEAIVLWDSWKILPQVGVGG